MRGRSPVSLNAWIWRIVAGLVVLLPLVLQLPAFAAASGPKKPWEPPSIVDKLLPELLAIAILIAVILFVILRLPKVELGHTPAFLRRRAMNWLPLGLTYAYMYMGRYNLNTLSKLDLIEPRDFSIINMVGAITYGVAFIINGPLTDRFGGKRTMLVGAAGAAIANVFIGVLVTDSDPRNLTVEFALLTALNMYFQSFGAVAIVKVNSPWFHVHERGTFGAIFGILISLGLYFAFDWNLIIGTSFGTDRQWIFFVPAAILLVFVVIDFYMVRDSPADAGFSDFDTGDASSPNDHTLSVGQVFKKMLTNPVILTIALVEFCTGFLRQTVLQYYRTYMGATAQSDFVVEHWGMLSACAGILGGIAAGVISDRVFKSRRGPVAAVLFGVIVMGSIVTIFGYQYAPLLGPTMLVMSMAVIGVHGMLSGTASMDFGGRRNTGVAVGIIDGFVYLGYGLMALIYSFALPSGDAKKDPDNWLAWPVSMLPMAVIGLLLARRLWHAKPTRGGGGH